MSAFGITFILLEAVAAVLLAGIVYLLAKPKAAMESFTVNNAEEETAATAMPLPADEEEPYDEPAAEIVTDDGEAEYVAESPSSAAEPADSEPVITETATEVVTEDTPVSYRLEKSFTAKLILTDEAVKERYSEIKNALLSYKKVKARTSWKCETFRFGRTVLVKLALRGKTLCVYLALSAEDIPDTKYRVESAGKRKANPVTPTVYKVRNTLRLKNAKQLIAILAQKHGLIPVERQPENFAPAYQTEEELLEQGLIRKVKGNNAYIKK